MALALASVLPVVLFSGWAAWQTGANFRETAEKRLQDTTIALAGAIETELASRYSLLALMVESGSAPVSSAARPRVAAMDNLWQPGVIEFVSADGTTGSGGSVSRQVIATTAQVAGRPIVGNLEFMPNGMPAVSLGVPGRSADGKAGAFVETVNPRALIQTLEKRSEELTGILVAVTDARGNILARSRDPARYVGQRAPDWDKLRSLRADSGLFEAVAAEGQTIVLTFRKLKGTPGWTVVVGEPSAVFNARWRNPVFGMAIGALLALLVALVFAAWTSRLILSPLRALARRAEALAAGAELPAPAPPSRVREFEALRGTFEESERAMRMNERRYRAMAESGTLLVWRWRFDTRQLVVNGWERLTGLPEMDVSELSWLDRIHAEDRERTRHHCLDAVARRQKVDVEFRILDRDDRWLWVRERGGPVFDDEGNAVEWVGVVEDIDERMEAHRRIEHMAHHDALTGLANRVLLTERLIQAAATDEQGGALLLLDLDRFKAVNDTHGHGMGDALLRQVAARLRECVSDGDTIARLGGDEFAILHRGATPESAAALAHTVIERVSASYEIDGAVLSIGVSVGVTMVQNAAADLDDLLHRADQAMYRAKGQGRGQARFFEQDAALDEMKAIARTERRSLRRRSA